MADSKNLVKATDVENHVLTYGATIKETTLLGFPSAKYLSMEGGIKGTTIMTTMEVVGNMGSNWRQDYAANPDAFDFIPRSVSTYMADFQFTIVPALLESSYIGFLRKKGQSVNDTPLLTYCMRGSINKKKTETNISIWRGVRNEAQKGNYLSIYDGYFTILGKELTANNPLIVPVATGQLTDDNILANVDAMWESLDETTQEKPLFLHCSRKVAKMYWKAMGKANGTNANEDYGKKLKEIQSIEVAPHAGIKGDELILTTEDNLVFAYDGVGDDESLNVQAKGKGWWYWADYREGVEFRTLDSRYMAINDQIDPV